MDGDDEQRERGIRGVGLLSYLLYLLKQYTYIKVLISSVGIL
jgi:hypothetical protein